MSNLNKMKEKLEANLPQKNIKKKDDVKDDYEYSREVYRTLIDTGTNSLDYLAALAKESEHPRAFEVLSKSIKDIGDTTEKLMSLQRAHKELEKENNETKRITNNNVFIGSTTDLQRMLLNQSKVIDVEDTQ